MDAIRATSISAGKAIFGALSCNPVITEVVTAIFPVAVDKADLPCILYNRDDGKYEPVKIGAGADASFVILDCCAVDYDSAVDLAEVVRFVLDGRSGVYNDIRMRTCRYMASHDSYKNDAYVVTMIFKVAIG